MRINRYFKVLFKLFSVDFLSMVFTLIPPLGACEIWNKIYESGLSIGSKDSLN
jgi:hypothetical protein